MNQPRLKPCSYHATTMATMRLKREGLEMKRPMLSASMRLSCSCSLGLRSPFSGFISLGSLDQKAHASLIFLGAPSPCLGASEFHSGPILAQTVTPDGRNEGVATQKWPGWKIGSLDLLEGSVVRDISHEIESTGNDSA